MKSYIFWLERKQLSFFSISNTFLEGRPTIIRIVAETEQILPSCFIRGSMGGSCLSNQKLGGYESVSSKEVHTNCFPLDHMGFAHSILMNVRRPNIRVKGQRVVCKEVLNYVHQKGETV